MSKNATKVTRLKTRKLWFPHCMDQSTLVNTSTSYCWQDTARRVCHTPMQQICCCGPGGQEISIDCCTAGAEQQMSRCQLTYEGENLSWHADRLHWLPVPSASCSSWCSTRPSDLCHGTACPLRCQQRRPQNNWLDQLATVRPDSGSIWRRGVLRPWTTRRDAGYATTMTPWWWWW